MGSDFTHPTHANSPLPIAARAEDGETDLTRWLAYSRPRTPYFTLCLVTQDNPAEQPAYILHTPFRHAESCLLTVFNLGSFMCYIC